MAKHRASDQYEHAGLAEFYDLNRTERLDFKFCKSLAIQASSALDLGCGTGGLATELAKTARVTGVDPAKAMLDIARARDGGNAVTWVEADAESVRLGERFDLIVLTGHAFQVFLTKEQQLAVLTTIAWHLNPNGRFILDTRNPSYPGRKERTKGETLHRIEHPEYGPVEKSNESSFDKTTGILTYSNIYRILRTGEVRSAQDRIRYTSETDLTEMIASAGLRVERWMGDWSGLAFEPGSKEIIPLGRLM